MADRLVAAPYRPGRQSFPGGPTRLGAAARDDGRLDAVRSQTAGTRFLGHGVERRRVQRRCEQEFVLASAKAEAVFDVGEELIEVVELAAVREVREDVVFEPNAADVVHGPRANAFAVRALDRLPLVRNRLVVEGLGLEEDDGAARRSVVDQHVVDRDEPVPGGLEVAQSNPHARLVRGEIGEIDVQPASSAGGENYGWNRLEGTRCFASDPCDASGTVLPIHEYDHDQGCSVNGGYVYRGPVSQLRGRYFFSDFCEPWIHSFVEQNGEAVGLYDHIDDFGPVSGMVSFGEDGAGELYIVSIEGTIYRIADAGGA